MSALMLVVLFPLLLILALRVRTISGPGDVRPYATWLSLTVSPGVQRIHAMVTSVSLADAMIAKFDLQQRYGTRSIEHNLKQLQEHFSTSIELQAGS